LADHGCRLGSSGRLGTERELLRPGTSREMLGGPLLHVFRIAPQSTRRAGTSRGPRSWLALAARRPGLGLESPRWLVPHVMNLLTTRIGQVARGPLLRTRAHVASPPWPLPDTVNQDTRATPVVRLRRQRRAYPHSVRGCFACLGHPSSTASVVPMAAPRCVDTPIRPGGRPAPGWWRPAHPRHTVASDDPGRFTPVAVRVVLTHLRHGVFTPRTGLCGGQGRR